VRAILSTWMSNVSSAVCVCVCVCVRVCACVHVRACARARVCVCARARVRPFFVPASFASLVLNYKTDILFCMKV
jgi:hypothetical protein